MPLLHASMKSLGRAEALPALVVFMAVTVGLSQEATSGVQSKGWTPIQLKYAKYIALFDNQRSVYGARLGVFEEWRLGNAGSPDGLKVENSDNYRASNIVGLDLALCNANPICMRGVQLAGLIAGSGGTKGIVVGGLIAGSAHDMRGVTVGGLFSGSAHDMRGIALGGVFAGARDDMRGVAVALMAGAGGDMRGLLIGGVTGVDDMCGTQFAFVGSHAATVRGAQVSLFTNICEDEMIGLQMSAVNQFTEGYEGVLRGVQIGAANLCRDGTVNGVQVGIINDCETLNGIQIGILNIVAGRLQWPLINACF